MLSYSIFENAENNEWITFIHGAGGSSTIWYKQIRAFQKQFNVLTIDLRGHGESQNAPATKNTYSFPSISDDIIEVLDYIKVESSHFVGISLGTILIRQIAEKEPTKVRSMILGGAILKMNFRSQLLMKAGNALKYVLPYLLLYKLFAFIILPRKNHKNSRLLFVNEAKKMNQKEFIKWFKLTSEINPILKKFRTEELSIPTLYVMGSEDYMFLPTIKKVVLNHTQSSSLTVINKCGHVVNIEQAATFNEIVLRYLKA